MVPTKHKKDRLKSEKFAKVTLTHAQTVTESKSEPKTEVKAEPKKRDAENDELLEKGLAALRKLGGEATSPDLVKELGFTGETARDKVRRLMGKLHDKHLIHTRKEGKVYHFKLADKPETTTETVQKTEAAA